MKSILEKIRDSAADFLGRKEALRSAKVVRDNTSSLESVIDTQLQQRLGLSIAVKLPIPTTCTVSGSAISYPVVIMTVRVMEIVPLNQTGLSCAAAAEAVLKALNGFTPEGAASPLTPRMDYPWNPLSGTTIAKLTGTATTSFTTTLPNSNSKNNAANAIEVVFTTSANI